MFVYFRFADIPRLAIAVAISLALWGVFSAPLDRLLGQASAWMVIAVVLSIGAVGFIAASYIWTWIVSRSSSRS
jgi:hypothetical protein